MMPPAAPPAPLVPPKLADTSHPAAPLSGWGWVALVLSGLVVILARLWRISTISFPDHDSGRNWLIANDVSQGDFHDLFVHLSPTFYLLMAPLAHWFGPEHFRWLIVLNALINATGLIWLARSVARWAALAWPEQALLTLLVGLSTHYTFAARELAITSPALLLLAWVVHLYWRRSVAATIKKRRRRLLLTVVVVAIGLTVNYKLVLLLPVGVVLEWVRRREGVVNGRVLLISGGLLLAPFLVYAGVAWAVGLPWYRLPAAWGSLLIKRQSLVAGGTDWLFYGRYLLRFESPLALVGLVAGPWLLLTRAATWPPRALTTVMTALGVGSLLLMTLLTDKAPRGLMLSVGPLLILGALGTWAAFGPARRGLARLVLGTAILAQISLLWREVWAWCPPALGQPAPHAQVAVWLRQHGARRVATTSALSLAPYAALEGLDMFAAPTADSLRALVERHNTRYVLLDNYRLVIGQDSLGADVLGTPVLQLTDPPQLSPMLFLEHAEFVHETYEQALNRQQKAFSQPWQLTLIDTQPNRR